MSVEHWKDDELLAHLYGAGPDGGHLDACSDCARRWEALRARRGRLLSESPAVSESLLAAQRSAVRARLLAQQPRSLRLEFAPTLATAVLLALVCLMVFQRQPEPRPTAAAVAVDAGLFDDVFTLVESPEPQAVEPVRSLFEVRQ
jgi:hypothetical protein